MKLKIYIACSLTHVPRSFFEQYLNTIHGIANYFGDYDVKYALVNSDPQLAAISPDEKAKYCYLWDRKMVEECDIVIAEASFPSIGLGIELQIAESQNIPIILIYNNIQSQKASPVSYKNPDNIEYRLQIGEGIVSLMALGLPNVLKVLPYENLDNCCKNLSLIINNS